MPGYAGGSASMFGKGVMVTPESLLSKGLPGAEGSISAYQLLRQSQFEGAKKPNINWVPELDPGFGQFKIATINDKEALKRAALYATTLSSFNVEGFGVSKTANLTLADVNQRMRMLTKFISP